MAVAATAAPAAFSSTAGGMSTWSITWMMPLVAGKSVDRIWAPFTVTPPLIEKVTGLPSSVEAFMPFTIWSALISPEIT